MQWLIRQERELVAAVLPALPGDTLVQAGAWGRLEDAYADSGFRRRVVLDRGAKSGDMPVQARARVEALPLRPDSVDAVVLAHTLEYSEDPHAVLREAHRALVAGGHLLVLGFDPWRGWGLWRLFLRHHGRPWSGQPFGEARLRDWLELLGFQVEDTRHAACKVPRLPLPCRVYMLVARKRVLPMTSARTRKVESKPAPVGGTPVGAANVGAAPLRRDGVV